MTDKKKINPVNKHLQINNENLETRKKQQEKRDKLIKQLKNDFNIVFSTPQGKQLGRWLIGHCGFLSRHLPVNKNGDISTEFLTYNKGRLDLYLQLRTFLSREVINELETINK